MKMEQSKRAAFVPVVITLESFEELLMLTATLGITGPKERDAAFERQTPLRIKPLCASAAVGRANHAIGDLYNNLANLAASEPDDPRRVLLQPRRGIPPAR